MENCKARGRSASAVDSPSGLTTKFGWITSEASTRGFVIVRRTR